MIKMSLVGIKAVDVVRAIEQDAVQITSYNKPLAVMIRFPASKRELYAQVEKVCKALFDEQTC